MRKISGAVLMAGFLAACCDAGSEPAPPYPNPDNTSRVTGADGFASVNYSYNCYQGQFVSVGYTRPDDCSDYSKDYEITSDGICPPTNALAAKLGGLSAADQVRVLREAGREVRVVFSRTGEGSVVGP